jgi:hypothetical protein
MPPPVVVDELPAPVVLEVAPVPRVLLELAPVVPGALLGGVGSVAPCCPAAVPGPMRPALSESAGEPDAAYAPTATDMQPAINANVSFFISTSR